MKKRPTKVWLGMALASSALLLPGCKKAEEPQVPVTVYGPPAYFEGDATPSPQPEKTPEATAAPDAFDPAANIPEDVYGPPSYWGGEDGAGEEQEQEPEVTVDPFEPEQNLPALVYGPPADFDE